MGFAADLEVLCKKAGDKAELVVRKTALDLYGQMIARTPVDTGRAKGSWQVGINSINTSEGAPDPSGAVSEARGLAAMGQWKAGDTIYLTLSLPYAMALEYGLYGKPPGSANGPKTNNGFSRQAPQGIVRLTVQNYSKAIAKAAAQVRSE